MDTVFGKKLGRYILLEKLGEGGMATVYNAFDSHLERNVALKIILPSRQSSQEFLDRFLTEAKALAQMTHANIVKVLDYGEENGQPYLVMEFIPGGTLKEAMDRPISYPVAAGLLAPIARALDYVHQQNLIHRDVKPANILMDDNDQPMLSDFGVVKLLEVEETSDTAATGVGIGTPDYMSPEQGMGRSVDFRVDMYALGVVFYEMIIGQKPFSADTPMGLVIRHVTDPFPRPRKSISDIPAVVEEVILKAVAKDPQKRFRDMSVFAEVLEALAVDAKANERRIRRLMRLKPVQPKQKKKRMSLVLRLAFIAAFLVILGAAGYLYRDPIQRVLGIQVTAPEAPTASVALLPSTTANTPAVIEAPATVTPAATVVPTAVPTVTVSEPTPTTEVATPTLEAILDTSIALIGTPPPAKSQEKVSKGVKEISLWGIGGVNVLDWSPDGQKVAIGTSDGIFVFKTGSLERLFYFHTGSWVNTLLFSEGGSKITAGMVDGSVRQWDAETGEPGQTFEYTGFRSDRIGNDRFSPVQVISYSNDDRYMVVGFKNGAINLWDLRNSEKPVATWEQYSTITGLVFSSDSRNIYIAHADKTLVVYDIFSQKTDRELDYGTNILPLISSPDNQYLLGAGPGNNALLIETTSDRVVQGFPGLGAAVTSIAMNLDQSLLAFGLANGKIKVFQMPEAENLSKVQTELYTIEAHPDIVTSLRFSPDGKTLASSSWQEGLKFWDAANQGTWVQSLDQSMAATRLMQFSPDSRWLMVENIYQQIQFWYVPDGNIRYTLEKTTLPEGNLFSPDGKYLVVEREAVEVWQPGELDIVELETGKTVQTLTGFQRDWQVEFSEDGKLLVMGNLQKALIWDTSTWQKVRIHGGPNSGCGQFFTPDNQRLAIISVVDIFFKYDEKVESLCASKPDFATYEALLPSFQYAILKVRDGKLWLWNLKPDEISRMKERLSRTPGQEQDLMAYSADSSMMVVDLAGEKVALQAATGTIFHTFDYQREYQYVAAISPDSKLLALGSKFGTIRLYTAP